MIDLSRFSLLLLFINNNDDDLQQQQQQEEDVVLVCWWWWWLTDPEIHPYRPTPYLTTSHLFLFFFTSRKSQVFRFRCVPVSSNDELNEYTPWRREFKVQKFTLTNRQLNYLLKLR